MLFFRNITSISSVNYVREVKPVKKSQHRTWDETNTPNLQLRNCRLWVIWELSGSRSKSRNLYSIKQITSVWSAQDLIYWWLPDGFRFCRNNQRKSSPGSRRAACTCASSSRVCGIWRCWKMGRIRPDSDNRGRTNSTHQKHGATVSHGLFYLISLDISRYLHILQNQVVKTSSDTKNFQQKWKDGLSPRCGPSMCPSWSCSKDEQVSRSLCWTHWVGELLPTYGRVASLGWPCVLFSGFAWDSKPVMSCCSEEGLVRCESKELGAGALGLGLLGGCVNFWVWFPVLRIPVWWCMPVILVLGKQG